MSILRFADGPICRPRVAAADWPSGVNCSVTTTPGPRKRQCDYLGTSSFCDESSAGSGEAAGVPIDFASAAAPVAGGWLTEHTQWPVIFLLLAAVGAFAAVLFLAAVPEDQRPQKVQQLKANEIVRDYLANLREPSYRMYAAAISLVSMAQVVFISHSVGPLEGAMGISPATYGLLLGATAVGSVSGTTAVRHLSKRYSDELLLRLASVCCFAGGLLFVGATLAASTAPWAVVGPMIVVMVGVGATVPLCQAGLINTSKVHCGNASGLFFFLQLSTATLYSATVGRWSHQGSNLLAVTIAVPCVFLMLTVWTGHRLMRLQSNRSACVIPTKA
jgi:DHA1 family bicyclomycin/chloramphenicol resistance-like MFS transporter